MDCYGPAYGSDRSAPHHAQGEDNARGLSCRLKGLEFAAVFSSPLQRAVRTCELAGFGPVAAVDRDLVEWDYGAFEGLTSAEIRVERPDWQLFRDGCPSGESPAQVATRADAVVRRIRAINRSVLLFSSGHFSRVLAARWIGLEPSVISVSLVLSTASVSVLGYERDLSRPAIRLWNDTLHVVTERK